MHPHLHSDAYPHYYPNEHPYKPPTPVFGTPTATPCGPGSIYFETEPNDTVATAMRLGSKNAVEVRGGVTSIGDIDYYSFEGLAGNRMWIYVFTNGATTSNDSE